MECKVNPGHTVTTDKEYRPGETLQIEADEAKQLEKRDIVTIIGAASGGDPGRPNVTETVKLVKAAATVAELDKLAEGEDRDTVLKAIEKRRAELTQAQ